MSGVGETRQPARIGWRTAWQVASWPANVIRLVLGLVLVGCVLVALAATGLAWRLAQGPLDVTWLVRRIEPMLQTADGSPRIRVGRATIAWNGFNGGAHSGLQLRLHDIKAGATDGTPGAIISRADVTLVPLPLLAATIAPRSIVLDGVQLRAVRGADGVLRFDAGGGTDVSPSSGAGSFSDVLAELRRPAGSAGSDPVLGTLELVVVEHAQVTLMDEASHLSVEGEIADLELRRREGGGITGGANGRFAVGGASVALTMTAALLPDGGMHAEATMAPLSVGSIDTGFLSRLDPALAIVGGVDTSMSAVASLDLSAALRPQQAMLQVSTGAGALTVPNSDPVTFDRVAVSGAATWDENSWQPKTLTIGSAEIVLVARGTRKSTAHMTADAVRQESRYEVKTALGFDQASFADLSALWPFAWGGHVRPWLTENVTAGKAHDAGFTATIAIPLADPGKASVLAAGGTMKADDVVIHWLRPVPPIEHAQATLTVTGPDDLVIAVPRASQGPVALRDGSLKFTGLSHKDQYLVLTAAIQGSVPDVIKVLREPRLQLLAAHPIPITNSAGKVSARLTVDVPMFDHLTFEQVSIASTGRLTGLRLGGLVAGRDLEHGDLSYDVTQDGLTASGPATVAGVAGQAELAMNFKSGPPTEVVQQARLIGRVGAAELRANGIDPAGMLTAGDAIVNTAYSEQRDGHSRVDVKADLAQAGLSIAGWHKAPGQAAQASATVLLTHGKLAGVPQLAASGPGLRVAARAETAGGEPRILRIDEIVLGPTRLAGEVVFPAEPSQPIRVRATGPVVDLSDQISSFTSGPSSGTGQSFIADVRLGRVILGHGRVLTEVAAHVEHVNGRLQSLQATTGGKERLRASITPAPNGRRLIVQAADTGALLKGMDLTSTIDGGVLSVDARYDDRQADPPLEGRLQLGNFAVHDAVIVGKLLQAVTVYGIADALRDKGVYFADMQVPFCLCQNVLQLGQSRAFSSSLGITAKGWVDFNRKLMQLEGTIVPAYALNAALGRIPWLGRLFSAERDGGLIAANFGVTGAVANPGVSVNPLSLLTPGFLRGLFGLFS